MSRPAQAQRLPAHGGQAPRPRPEDGGPVLLDCYIHYITFIFPFVYRLTLDRVYIWRDAFEVCLLLAVFVCAAVLG